MKHPSLFLDRDGTLIEEMGYINHPDRLRLLPRAAEAIKLLNRHQILVIVVTNQSGVARGYFPESMLELVHQRLLQELTAHGARVDKLFYCPHHPTEGPEPYRRECPNRKPNTGFVLQAEQEFPLDRSRSYSVGDRHKDLVFARNAGMKAILTLTGYGKGEYLLFHRDWQHQPDFIATDLLEAAQWILNDLGIPSPYLRKVRARKELAQLLAVEKRRGKRVVFANGCFDILHGGHVSYLEDARSQGDLLVVGINSDVSVHKIKGPSRPFIPLAHRLELLDSLDCVDYLVTFDEDTCDGLLRQLHPHVHAKGTDYTRETVPERQTARELGIETYIAGDAKENATREIIQTLKQGKDSSSSP